MVAGHDTEVFKNSTKAPSKRSFVERNTDKIIILMFGILLAMIIVSMVFIGIWVRAEQWCMPCLCLVCAVFVGLARTMCVHLT